MEQRTFNYGTSLPITVNKSLEIQLVRFTKIGEYFEFDIRWSHSQDHAGFSANFSLFGLFFNLAIQDNRHWNYTEKRWFLPSEEHADEEDSEC